ncbi:MAG: VCBS repeat-containing protein [bacterium]|nr:VCBS repeat-containing protein [bacterium]
MLRISAFAGLILGTMVVCGIASSFAAEIPGWPKLDKAGPVGLTTTGKQVQARAFGDVDGNGKADCVVAKGTGVAVFARNDDGTWTETAEMVHPTGTAKVSAIAIADSDGDGKQEIFFGTTQGNGNECRVYIFEYKESKAFVSVGVLGPYANKSAVKYLKAVDIDLDGKPEIVVMHAYGRESYVRLYASRENDKWTEVWKDKITEEGDTWYRYPNTVAVADLDKDKKPEIYMAVEAYDRNAKKCHGWLYAYKMKGEPDRYQYEKIWSSDDLGAYVTDVRLVQDKQGDKKCVAAQVNIPAPPSPVCWALFGLSEKESYSLLSVKTVKDFHDSYEACEEVTVRSKPELKR